MVIARYFGAEIEAIFVSEHDLTGRVEVRWGDDDSASDRMIMATLASDECLRAFGIPSPHELHFFGDAVTVMNLLEARFPDDEKGQNRHREKLELLVGDLLNQTFIRAAVRDLAGALFEQHSLSGAEAMLFIDQHLLA